MEHRIRLFQETLQQKLSDPFLVRRYEGLYYHDAPSVSSTRKIATTATATTKTEPEGTTHDHEDTSSSTTRGDSTNTTKGGDTDDRKKFRKIRLTTDEALKLSHIPWELRQHDNAGGERTTMEGGTTTTNSRQPPPKCSNETSSSSHYMHESHLDLRLMQNTHWAEGRLAKGVEFAKLALEATTASGAPPSAGAGEMLSSAKAELVFAKKAESCYKEGLEMIPNHASLCVAYGALCANDGRLELAKSLFLKALPACSSVNYTSDREDGNDESYGNGGRSSSNSVGGVASRNNTNQPKETVVQQNARLYLAAVEKRIIEKKTNSSSLRHTYHQKRTNHKHMNVTNSMPIMSNRAEKALQDAITERDFLMGPSPPSIHPDSSSSTTTNAVGASTIVTASSTRMSALSIPNHEHTNGTTHNRGLLEPKTYNLLAEPATTKHKHNDDDDDDNDSDDDDKRRRRRRRRKRHESSKRHQRRTSNEKSKRQRRRSEGTTKRYEEEDSGIESDSDDDTSSCDDRRRSRHRRRRKHKSLDRSTSRHRRRHRKRQAQSPSSSQEPQAQRSSKRSKNSGGARKRRESRSKRGYTSPNNSTNVSSSSDLSLSNVSS